MIEYGPEDIDSKFKSEHADIFAYKRGNGLWLWKPYVIYKTLCELKNGDILFYMDSGAFWIKRAKKIFDIIMDEDVFVSNIPMVEKQFTKRYCFEKLGLNINEYGETNQIQGGFVGLKKSERGIRLVEEWLALCCQRELLAGDVYPDGVDNTFVTHQRRLNHY